MGPLRLIIPRDLSRLILEMISSSLSLSLLPSFSKGFKTRGKFSCKSRTSFLSNSSNFEIKSAIKKITFGDNFYQNKKSSLFLAQERILANLTLFVNGSKKRRGLFYEQLAVHLHMLLRAPDRAHKRKASSFVSGKGNLSRFPGFYLAKARFSIKIRESKTVAYGLNVADAQLYLFSIRDFELFRIPVPVIRRAGDKLNKKIFRRPPAAGLIRKNYRNRSYGNQHHLCHCYKFVSFHPAPSFLFTTKLPFITPPNLLILKNI